MDLAFKAVEVEAHRLVSRFRRPRQRGDLLADQPLDRVRFAWRLEISKQDGRDLRLYLARAQEE